MLNKTEILVDLLNEEKELNSREIERLEAEINELIKQKRAYYSEILTTDSILRYYCNILGSYKFQKLAEKIHKKKIDALKSDIDNFLEKGLIKTRLYQNAEIQIEENYKKQDELFRRNTEIDQTLVNTSRIIKPKVKNKRRK